jgi:hypothetical protein
MLIIFILFIVISLAELYLRIFSNYNEAYFDNDNKIIKRKSNTEGKYKIKFTYNGYFRINNEGWNSWRDFFAEKDPGICRIAIIGHSNVEGLRVSVNKTFPKILEDKLISKNKNVEVYTFGFGGMHMAQALHVTRYVVKTFHPDIVIIGTLMDNFFIDHAEHHDFLSLRLAQNNIIREIVPESNESSNNSPLSPLYFLKTIKYTDIRFQLGDRINRFIGNMAGVTKEKKKSHVHAFLEDTIYYQKNLLGIEYILKEFGKLSTQVPGHLIFLAFPITVPSYNFQNQIPDVIKLYENKKMNLIKRLNFPGFNLDSFFVEDYKKHNRKFDFPNDGHYNEHAHNLIGEVLSDYLINNHFVH